MSKLINVNLKVKHTFDPIRFRHYLNGDLSVMHCHHYSTLYTQLAEDADFFNGKKILFDVSEETFYRVLLKYFEKNGISELEDMITIAEQYWAFVGMGKLKITSCGISCGSAELLESHIDNGWLKKWGKHKTPINHITRGFLAALWSILNGATTGIFDVIEVKSIVMGDSKSEFKIIKK